MSLRELLNRVVCCAVGQVAVLSMLLRYPIEAPKGRRLRICIYARYSTEEQRATSIDDQVAFCRRALNDWEVNNADIEVISDPETSGELRDRPGISEVRRGVEAGRYDLILCEDSSRLFRNESACFEFVEIAVDEDVRVICLNDNVDTAEEDWDERLHNAQRVHSRDNYYTRLRIARTHRRLWETGAAVGPLRPGHRRRATTPATAREPEKGPFFDKLDPDWTPTIYTAFERIASGELPDSVAAWLSEVGLPKVRNKLHAEWTAANVISLIRRAIYRGHDTHRETIVKRRRRTGVARQVRNDLGEVWTRSMEHLRIVPDWLWYRANDAIDARVTCKTRTREDAHPLYAIPRDSRFPLSNLMFCVCGEKVWSAGRNEGGYRCRAACRGDCWNKATAKRNLTHERLGSAIARELLGTVGHLDAFVAHLGERLASDVDRDQELRRRRTTERTLVSAIDRLGVAIELGNGEVETLLNRLTQREDELARERAEIERLENQCQTVRAIDPQQLRSRVEELTGRLLELGKGVNVLLRRLIPEGITAMPYQRIDCGLVVLRAEFELSLAPLLPEQLALVMAGELTEVDGPLARRRIVADLFEEPPFVAHAAEAWKLKQEGRTLDQIGSQLGIAKRQAHLASQLGRAMAEAGLDEPYIRLTQTPEHASRWRSSTSSSGDAA